MVNKGREYATAWNFGPELTDTKPVKWITERLVSCMETSSKIVIDLDHNPHESNVLTLNSSKAFNKLNWKGAWDIERSIESIADFYIRLKRNEPPRQILNDQIKSYFGAL